MGLRRHLRVATDALHLATAIECGATSIYTYDTRQAVAATNAGIAVVTPH